MAGESKNKLSCHLLPYLLNQEMRIHMTVKATGHFLMHGR